MQIHVYVEWMAWSDAGGGVARGGPDVPVRINSQLPVKDLWLALADTGGAPIHHYRLWCVRGARFMHDPGRTVESYGVKDGDTLYVLLRCSAPLVE